MGNVVSSCLSRAFASFVRYRATPSSAISFSTSFCSMHIPFGSPRSSRLWKVVSLLAGVQMCENPKNPAALEVVYLATLDGCCGRGDWIRTSRLN